MAKCKNCKNPLQKDVTFCGICGYPIKKSRLSKTAKRVILVSVLVLLIVIAWTQRIGISRLTDGRLFGYKTTNISAEEMDGEIKPVTQKEQEKFVKYAQTLQAYGEGKLFGKRKTLYQEYNALFALYTDVATGKTQLSLDTIEDEFNKKLKDFKGDHSLINNVLDSLTLTVYADESTDVIIDSELYLAYLLKNSATTLLLHGEKSLALAMSSMAACLAPSDSSMSNLLANVLKEYGLTHSAYEMFQYAVRVNPNDEAALHSLGMICVDLEEYDEARSCFNRLLRLTEGKGPGNQGMMLLSLAEGDLPSAYLYMLEGAREGYTHTITEVYETFKKRSDYFEIAGPIFDQYQLYDLVNFEKTQQIFDATLDTPEQQAVIDRKLLLCHDALGSMFAQATNLLQCKRYFEDMTKLILENFIGYMSTLSGELSTIKDLLNDPDLGALFGGDLSAIWDLKDKYGTPEKDPTVYTYSYEQEIFFLNILQDYFNYNIEKNMDKYWYPALDILGGNDSSGLITKYMETFEQYTEEKATWMENIGVDSPNIYTQLMATLQVCNWMVNNGENNGVLFYESSFTIEEYTLLNKAMSKVSPLLEKGYHEQAILCEEYYLYTNGILGYIANDKIYNEWRYYELLNIEFALLYYPMIGGAYNEVMAMMATIVWGTSAGGGDFEVHIPDTPEFPVTGMGTPNGEPVVVWEYEPPQTSKIEEAADTLWGEMYEDNIDILQEEFGFTENTLTDDIEPALTVILDPAHNKPATTMTEETASPTKLGIKLGKILEASFDPATGDISIGASALLVSGKMNVNFKTKDVTLYGHGGPDLDASVGVGGENSPTSFSAGSFKIGGYAKLTLNVADIEITSAEVGADVGASMGGFGVETEVGYDFASGVRKDTASKLRGNIKQTLTTTE